MPLLQLVRLGSIRKALSNVAANRMSLGARRLREAHTSPHHTSYRSFCSTDARRSAPARTSPSQSTGASTFGKGAILFAAGLAAGLSLTLTTSPWSSTTKSTADSVEPTYGSPDDFQAAISELRDIFKDTAGKEDGEVEVSTDPDDLEVHGFSDNDYHPSEFPHPPEISFLKAWPLCLRTR